MIVTGIAPAPQQLEERSSLPSNELVYLASKALKTYKATRLITSLQPGWEQALAKAAIECKIPYVVSFPYPGRDSEWSQEMRVLYYELLSRAAEVYQICDEYTETALRECQEWQTDKAELVLALWDYDFDSQVFSGIRYAVDHDVQVCNLWQDWESLTLLRKNPQPSKAHRRKGAQVY
jgi:hypothetical protein